MKSGLPILLSLSLGLAACLSGARPKGGLTPLEQVSADEVNRALGAKRVALVVGINTFADERWPDLKHAVQDAVDVGRALADPERGRFDQVEVLADPEGVGRQRVSEAFERLAASNTSAADTVVIFFSTHGTLQRGPQGHLSRYLVTSDTRQAQIQHSALRVRDLMTRFEALPSRRKVFILASCHSGGGKSALPGEIQRELAGVKGAFFVRPLDETSQASMVLTACAWGETAREDDELGHDIYTHFLLEALDGQDQDGDGAVTASEAHAHAMSQTYYYSQGRQRPQVESRVLGADPIVLSGRRTRPADPVLFSFLPRLTGLRVEVDGRDKGELPARLVLSPGKHRVVISEPAGPDEQDRPEPLVDTQVDLAEGDQLAIESLVERERPAWSLEARAGYQQFFDAIVRREFVAPLPVVSISISRLRFPMDSMETGLDLTLAGGAQSLQIGGLEVHSDLLQVGYGLHVLFRLDAGPVSFLLGPRLAGLHLIRRDFNPDGSDQRFANISPGLLGRMRWQLPFGLTITAEVRAHYLSIHTHSGEQDTGYLDLLGGLGWSW